MKMRNYLSWHCVEREREKEIEKEEKKEKGEEKKEKGEEEEREGERKRSKNLTGHQVTGCTHMLYISQLR